MLTATADRADQQQSRYIGAADEQHNADSEKEPAKQRAHASNNGFAQGKNIATDVDGDHVRRKIEHDLLRDAIRVLRGLLQRDTVPQARDKVGSPCAGGWGKLIGGEARGHPKLRLPDTARKQRKFEAARHDTNNGVIPAVESDRGACNLRIAVKPGES
jgi:hypothetical protein